MQQSCVVYKISCHDCEVTYIGQTKRQLKTRVREHRSDINKRSGSISVISDHRLNNHDFDWRNVKILDKEQSCNKRLISEMLHIKNDPQNINKQSDTELFPNTYLPYINKF